MNIGRQFHQRAWPQPTARKGRHRLQELVIILLPLVLCPFLAASRMLQICSPKELVTKSKLVFVGRVKSVKPSQITTSLSYIPWEGVTFRWLITEIEVIEPFKGVRKNEIVTTAMLSVDESKGNRPNMDPPGMIAPETGDIMLLCLSPTPVTNVFAAITAPYDENLSIFPLHRSRVLADDDRDFMTELLSKEDGFAPIFALVRKDGQLDPEACERFRQTFAAELGKAASTNRIHLEWETYTNPFGWRHDVPKGAMTTTNANSK